MRVSAIALSKALLFLASLANGYQDTAYYPGFSNPNTQNELYYRQAVNVIQDLQLGQFDSLYIQYHGCVWSEYGNGGGNEGNDEAGCGGAGDDWYIGITQCFRANVAFSLYGIKAGRGTSEPCSERHYINSFFTFGGIESFGDSLGVAYNNYEGASTACAVVEGDDNNQTMAYNGELFYPYQTSKTLGCSASGDFMAVMFQGAYCSGNQFIGDEDGGELEELNSELGNITCFPIYNATSYGEDAGDGDYGDAAINLLSYSSACSHNEYPETCPDPHGVKRRRDDKLRNYAQSKRRPYPLSMPITSTILFIAAAVLYCMANGMRDAIERKLRERGTGEDESPSIYERFTYSVSRTITGVSSSTHFYAEKLAEYAEEEESDDDDIDFAESMDSKYQAPSVSVDEAISSSVIEDGEATEESEPVRETKSQALEDENHTQRQKEVTDAMMSEKGITPTQDADPSTKDAKAGRKKKRPLLGKASKWLRSRFSGKKK